MLSGYFKIKTRAKDFHQSMVGIIDNYKEKKVLLYGAGSAFLKLNEEYSLTKNLDIVAIADKKFEKKVCKNFCGIKAIKPQEIVLEDFDAIIVTNEYYEPIVEYLHSIMQINDNDIIKIFEQKIPDERKNLNYLYKMNCEKQLIKLAKKLNNKKIVLYGASAYLKLIFEYFDMTKFNISAVSDKKYIHNLESSFESYKTCTPNEIESFEPDYVLISTKYYINIFEELYTKILKNKNIKILPLVDKPLFALIRELWQS